MSYIKDPIIKLTNLFHYRCYGHGPFAALFCIGCIGSHWLHWFALLALVCIGCIGLHLLHWFVFVALVAYFNILAQYRNPTTIQESYDYT